MVTVQVVTGYVPIKDHPRSAAEYGELGSAVFTPLVQAGVNVKRYMETLDMCWLHKYVDRFKTKPQHSVADNPEKNTLAYHCVQHQKFGWLLKAAIEDPRPDVYVWVDYGIGHVPGVNADVVWDFLEQVKSRPAEVAIPGCWTKEMALSMRNYNVPSWRFCGGVLVVPRTSVHKLYKAVKTAALRHIDTTKNVEWEVNTLASAEILGLLPKFRWYKADHDATMFTGYVPCDA